MSSYHEFFCPVKILCGEKALEHIPIELNMLAANRPLIITDPGVRAAGLIDHVLNAFRESNITIGSIFDQTPQDSSLQIIKQVAGIYSATNCNAIIAIGGGSALDTAKGVNILVSEKADDLMKLAGAGILKRALKPFIAIPTTAGTGSEVTSVAVIADPDQNRKIPFVSHFLLPNVAVLDARMTLSLPSQMTAATAMDALTHAVEAYTCLGKNPLSDAYSFAAIKMISGNLFNVLQKPNDKSGRLALATAATYAGISFSNSMVGMVHALGHSVGALCHVPHGAAMSILLPYVLEYNLAKGNKDYQTYVGELLLALAGSEKYAKIPPEQRAAESVVFITEMKNELFRQTGLPRTLKETGKVLQEIIPEIAKISVGDPSSIYNPVEVDYEDALTVLNRAYEIQ